MRIPHRSPLWTILRRLACVCCSLALLMAVQPALAQEADLEPAEKMGKGLLTIVSGVAVTALGVVILDNLPNCDGKSEIPDPETGKRPKDECEEESDERFEFGAVVTVAGLVLIGSGVFIFGKGAVEAVAAEPETSPVRLAMVLCLECRPAPVALGLRYRF